MFRTFCCCVFVAAAIETTTGGRCFAAEKGLTTLQLIPAKGKQGAADGKSLRKAVEIIRLRLKSDRVKDARVSVTADKQIEVRVPSGNASIDRIKLLVSQKGSLEFAILANKRDHRALILRAQKTKGDLRSNGRLVASWKTVAVDGKGKLADLDEYGEVATRTTKVGGVKLKQFLIAHSAPEHRLTERDLLEVKPANDVNGRPAIHFRFSKKGAAKLEKLTGDNLPADVDFRRRLAVILDDRLITAPSIISKISGEAELTGRFTPSEVMRTVRVLNVHEALPITIESVRVKKE